MAYLFYTHYINITYGLSNVPEKTQKNQKCSEKMLAFIVLK